MNLFTETFESFINEQNEETIVFQCPHCYDFIHVKVPEINCTIFRHGVYKHNYEQINPHESKENCDRLYENKEIYGCGRPFRIIKLDNHLFKVEICGYI